jgi:hypothetical protein
LKTSDLVVASLTKASKLVPNDVAETTTSSFRKKYKIDQYLFTRHAQGVIHCFWTFSRYSVRKLRAALVLKSA